MENKAYVLMLRYFEYLTEKSEPLAVITYDITDEIGEMNADLKRCYNVLMEKIVNESIDPYLDTSLRSTIEYMEMEFILTTNGALSGRSMEDFLSKYNSPSLSVQEYAYLGNS